MTLLALGLATAACVGFVATIGRFAHAAVTATEIALYLASAALLALAATTDPGVVPRNGDCDDAEAASCAAEMRVLHLHGAEVPMKWCHTCRIYRRPRPSRCKPAAAAAARARSDARADRVL